jgi:hypothetical protein
MRWVSTRSPTSAWARASGWWATIPSPTSTSSGADIHLFRLFWRFAASLKPDRASLPNLFAHHDRMLKRAAVQRTLEVESAVGYELPA